MSGFANPFRRQLPAYSPVHLGALAVGAWRGSVSVVPFGPDPRRRLARQLEAAYEAEAVALLGSGTQALTLALELGRRLVEDPRAAVALPAYSCFDLATAAVAAGTPVRFYDLDPATLGPEPTSLARAMEDGARVVVIAPLFGIPVDWDRIDPVLSRWRPVVVEDAAQGHGARWNGAPLGSRGEFSVLSFGRGKGWTGGSGGALLARGERAGGGLLDLLEDGNALPSAGVGGSVRTWAGAGALWAVARPDLYRIPRAVPGLGLGETRYREPGPMRTMAAAAAGIVLATGGRAEDEAEARRRNARELQEHLARRGVAAGVTPPEGGTAGYLRFPVRVPGAVEGMTEPRRARFLGAEGGYPRILPTLDALRSLAPVGEEDGTGNGPRRWPGAEALVRELVTLPTHSRTRSTERAELASLVPGGR